MKIANAQIQFAASHSAQSSTEIRESLRAWTGQRPSVDQAESAAAGQPNPAANDPLHLSESGRQAQQKDMLAPLSDNSNSAQAIKDSSDTASKDPKIVLLKAIIEAMLKRRIQLFDPSALAAAINEIATSKLPSNTGDFGAEYSLSQSHSESEQTDFSAQGQIITTDGANIQFAISLEMSRSYSEESNVSVTIGNARKAKDPLVINFDGTAAQLSDQQFSFDLNNSGQQQTISFVGGNSGFLALDKNNNGKIDNGSELFGPSSGNGFQDLATYDSDHNGWIDENDSVFNRLRVWTKDNQGNDTLSTLQDKNIGALYLGKISTPFTLQDSNHQSQGQITQTGIFLQEDGKAGTMQQLDLVT